MELNLKETYRYLGYKGQEVNEDLENLILETANQLKSSVSPKSIYRIFDCNINDGQITIGKLKTTSKNLARNLRGCDKVAIMAATLGNSADILIKRYSVSNMAKAAILQAAGAALIESFCDDVEEEIRELALTEQLYLRPRFSPGYGDFPLEHQKDIFDMLECSKRIGISLTDTLLMVPSKSVTAIIGMSTEEKSNCHREKCTGCNKVDCEYRG